MSARLSLSWRGGADIASVSLKALTKALFAGSPSQAERCPVIIGRRRLALGEVFRIRGDFDLNAPHLLVTPAEARVDDIGYGWPGGRLEVDGHAGYYCGAAMKGGEIEVNGCAADYAAAGMSGGALTIKGSAGAFLGAPLAGIVSGVTGGLIIVKGNVGDYAGDRMRRGLMAIAGDVGRFCGARMQAGTLAVLGKSAGDAGRLMKRGTILLASVSDKDPWKAIPPSFGDCGVHDLPFFGMLTAHLRAHGMAVKKSSRFRRFAGDLSHRGMGEILLPV